MSVAVSLQTKTPIYKTNALFGLTSFEVGIRQFPCGHRVRIFHKAGLRKSQRRSSYIESGGGGKEDGVRVNHYVRGMKGGGNKVV